MFKKVLSMVLVLTMVIAQLSLVSAMEESKDYEGHWASTTIESWMAQGLIKGFPDGSFQPDTTVTRAQFVTMIDNVFGFQAEGTTEFSDVVSTDWYYDAVMKASAAGVVQGSNGMFRPNDLITRQEASVALYNAYIMEEVEESVLEGFEDVNTIAAWALLQENALVAKGYMKGRTDTTLVPTGHLTRAEALTLLANISGDVITEAGTVTGEFSGNVLINAEDVVLEDATIEGNLYVAQGIGEGDVTLNNVTINGELVVLGGGENSIKLNNTSINRLVVIKVGGKVRIVATGSTKINDTVLRSGGKLQETDADGGCFGKVQVAFVQPGESISFDGDFDEVNVHAANVSINVENGSIGALNISKNSEGTKINVSTQATIKKATIEAKTDFSGDGTIEEADVQSDDVSFEKDPDKVTEEDSTPSIGGGGGGGGGGTTPTDVNLYITASAGSETPKSVTIKALPTADYTEIFRQVVTGTVGLMESGLYDQYSGRLDNFFVYALKFVDYADNKDLEGTIFAPVAAKSDTEARMLEALKVMKDNYADMATIEADLTEIALKVPFEEMTYNGLALSKLTLSDGGQEVALNVSDNDTAKEEYIAGLFDKLEALTMTSEVIYTLTIELEGDISKEASIKTSTTD
jgi:hypothetical protein